MIPAHGYEASYGTRGTDRRPVVAWDDEGYPMVYSRDAGSLVRADVVSDFTGGVFRTPPAAALVPGGGWLCRDMETGVVTPVVVWAVDGRGASAPLVADTYGGLAAPDYTVEGYRRHVTLPEPDVDAYLDYANRTLKPETPFGHLVSDAEAPGELAWHGPAEILDAMAKGVVTHLCEQLAEQRLAPGAEPRIWWWRSTSRPWASYLSCRAVVVTTPWRELPEPAFEGWVHHG